MDLSAIINCDVYPTVSRPSVCAPINYGDNDLGRAMSICEKHIAYSALQFDPPPRIPNFQKGWEACKKVFATWQDSEDARRQREYEAEIERQRKFVEEVAGALK